MTLQKIKVYELAKEFGMESISLLEKLKQLDIDVKSHMSALGTEEIRIVRDHFAKEKAAQSKSRSTKTTTRRASAGASGETSGEKRSTSTVIRRRSKSSDSAGAEDTAPQTQVAETAQPERAERETVVRRAPAPAPVEEPEQQEATPAPVAAREAVPAQEALAPAPEVEETAAPAAPVAEAAPAEQIATSEEPTEDGDKSSFSFDIIKVIPKAATPPEPPAPRPAPVVVPPVRPRSTINVTQRAAPVAPVTPGGPPPVKPLATPRPAGFSGRFSPGGRGSYQKPMGAGGPGMGARGPGVGAPRGPGVGGFGAGRFGVPGPLPTPAIGRNNFNRDRGFPNADEELRKKTGAGRGEKETTNVEDVKLLDYRAKKELIFLPKKKKIPPNRELHSTQITTPAAHKRVIRVENSITVNELADRMGVKVAQLTKKLIGMGVMAGMNQAIDLDTASLIAGEFGFEIENVAFKEEQIIAKDVDAAETLKSRPPIVTVMGHVDHGKTSLLDAIRQANVAAGEAGGITQHIGAYTVQVNDRPITFIDTPGHEAFTMMRARGANVTDIVILVVAADDGIMPQTREAIDHARSAGVPIVVAINKIDKPTANRERVLKGLAELDLLAEEWGGQIMTYNVSALKRTGLKELLEGVLLQAEILDLKANPDRLAEGTVLEARLDKSRGPTATVLVKRGTMRVGENIVAGPFVGRIRAMVDHRGEPVQEAGPSMAAEILGLEGVPTAGDNFNIVKNDEEARTLQTHRVEETRRKEAAKGGKISLEEIFSKIQKGDLKELPIILKTDVFGSTEALKESLNKLSNNQVKVKILSASVGGVTESDVLLASASNALILGFNVRPDTGARRLAERENIEIKTYSIIYELIDDVKKAMAGLLPKQAVEKYLGRAEVRETFSVPSVGVIAGCSVIDGKVTRTANVRLLRENRVIYTGKIASLRRFKDDAKEVAQGYECGIGIENYRDIKIGDVIEAFYIEMVAQELQAPTQQAVSQS